MGGHVALALGITVALCAWRAADALLPDGLDEWRLVLVVQADQARILVPKFNGFGDEVGDLFSNAELDIVTILVHTVDDAGHGAAMAQPLQHHRKISPGVLCTHGALLDKLAKQGGIQDGIDLGTFVIIWSDFAIRERLAGHGVLANGGLGELWVHSWVLHRLFVPVEDEIGSEILNSVGHGSGREEPVPTGGLESLHKLEDASLGRLGLVGFVADDALKQTCVHMSASRAKWNGNYHGGWLAVGSDNLPSRTVLKTAD